MSFDYTPSQRLAIDSRGSAVLVSAAAGSGKTRVLTQRLLDRVSDPANPVDIDRFLVITFTRAAAAELRSRIMDALAELAAVHPGDARLRRQQSLCCRAPIGTIHSFCTTVLREYSQLLGLSPAFSVMEEDRASQMLGSVASRLLDRHYETIDKDADFRLLADTVGAGRNDNRLQETLLQLYGKLRSHPDSEDWAAAQKSAFALDSADDAGKTVWGRELLDAACTRAEYWANAMEQAVAEIHNGDEKLRKAYETSFETTAASLRDFCRAAAEGNWDRAAAFSEIPFPDLNRLVKYPDAEKKDRLTAVRNGCKKYCETLRDSFSQNSESQLRELRAVAPAMNALLDLALELDRAYAAEKQRRALLDFSDLEHYTARLLVDKGSGAPTWVAVELSQRYAEVMVDEYQDVNAVQELIFRAVSRQSRNLFLVGDVKQSIYRFRLADPGLFLEKYRSYAPAASAAEGAPRRIDLQENFRSRRPILEAANHVMHSIMSEALGELDYDDSAALKYGAVGYDHDLDAPAELHIVDGSADSISSGSEAEARLIANRILTMVRAGTPVTENGVTRPCIWSDFVLLMRSPGGKGKVFHRVLAEAGIPVESRQGGGFFTSLEVSIAIDLLSIIDNPHADVPLISVLRSPAFGFSADELSAIRTADRNSDFFSALRAAAESGNQRCTDFLSQLGRWRSLAPEIGLDALVWRLYSDTGLLGICAAMSDGEQRRRNLMQLFEFAHSFGESGYKGVFRFVQWLHRMAEKGIEPELGTAGQVVRILSIHKSKGLEFPFVFLCDLAHRFNTEDTRHCVLLHSELGLGPKFVDADRGLEYPTLARRAVAQRLTTEQLSEEMRLLYVGMTRARERLFLTCTWKTPEKTLNTYRLTPVSPLPPELLRRAGDFSAWAAMAAVSAPDILPIVIHSGEEATVPSFPAAVPGKSGADAAALSMEKLRQRLDFVYPRAAAENLPSKITATELKRVQEAPEEDAVPVLPAETGFRFRRPEPGKTEKLTAAQRGTATHAFLQYVNFSKTSDAAGLRAEAKRLTASGLLTPEEASVIDFSGLERFFASELGQKLRSAAEVKREFRFLLLVDAEDYFPAAAGSGDQLLLQGVVDCCFEENGGITLLDYKTDHVSRDAAPIRAERYRPQLETYAKALERIFDLPVKRRVLWFLQSGTAVEL